MPVKSKSQARLMGLVKSDPKAAKRLGIPQSVGEEFLAGGVPKGLPQKAKGRSAKRVRPKG